VRPSRSLTPTVADAPPTDPGRADAIPDRAEGGLAAAMPNHVYDIALGELQIIERKELILDSSNQLQP
jgi:hypothetical protein